MQHVVTRAGAWDQSSTNGTPRHGTAMRIFVCMIAAILVAFSCRPALAQTDASTRWLSVTTVTVIPERRHEFERHLKRLVAAHRKAGTPWLRTWQAAAGNTMEYTVVVPVARFGDLDEPSAAARALGASAWERLHDDLARCALGETREYATPRPELNIDKADAPIRSYWIETVTDVMPGKMIEYLTWLQNDYRPALEKAGVSHFDVSQPIFGAVANRIVTARMIENFAEIDAGPVLARALADDAVRAVNEKAAPLIRVSMTKILQLRQDLSLQRAR